MRVEVQPDAEAVACRAAAFVAGEARAAVAVRGRFLLALSGGVTPRRMLWLALGVGLSTEAAQLAVSLLIGAGYHSIDINDTLLNAVGVMVGYGLYQGVVKLIRLL